MDAEKNALQRRIDTLDQYATRLHAALTGAEREIARLTAELETVKRERDALMWEVINADGRCEACKFGACPVIEEPCATCNPRVKGKDSFAWRGLCAENGGAEDAKG